MTDREPYAGRVSDEYSEREFTEWLAGERSLPALGDRHTHLDKLERAVGIELWRYEAEVRYDGEYDGYSADIVARGFDGEEFVDVVIEAQFDRNKQSAQNHLGKLLLYGNLADADTLVWLTDAELDSRMHETVAWLAPRAPHLTFHIVQTDVVSGADGIETLDFDRAVPGVPSDETALSTLEQHQRRFWGQFIDESETGIVDRTQPPSPGPVYKQGRAIPVSGVRAELVIDSTENCSKVRVRFERSAPEALYATVAAEREDIQLRVSPNEAWIWDDPAGSPPFSVTVRRSGLNLTAGENWQPHQRWLETVLQRVRDEIVGRASTDQ